MAERSRVVQRDSTMPKQRNRFSRRPRAILAPLDLPRSHGLVTSQADLLSRAGELYHELELRKKWEVELLQLLESSQKRVETLLQNVELGKTREQVLLQHLTMRKKREEVLLEHVESSMKKEQALVQHVKSSEMRVKALQRDVESKRKREEALLEERNTLQKERDEWSGLCSKSKKTMNGLECELEEAREKRAKCSREVAAYLALVEAQAAHQLQEQLAATLSQKHSQVATLVSQLAELEKDKAAIMTRILEDLESP